MTSYDKDLPVSVLFPMETVGDTLAEIISRNGLTQIHVAESEKYPHVTYFFNGRIETPLKARKESWFPHLKFLHMIKNLK